jgi:polyisoprenoid-binding protein YceI
MKKMLFSAAVALLSFALNAKPAPTPYKVDATKSTFKWTGKKVTGSHWGYVKFSDGTLNLENGALVGGSFNVDMTSIDCQDIQGGGAQKLVGHLKSDDFFGVDKFAKATLIIKSATSTGSNQYNVVADLTIKGVTNEVTFPATVSASGTSLTANATFSVNRTKYGIRYGSGSFFDNLGDKTINDNFDVEINLAATSDAVPAAAPPKKKKKKKATN